MRSKIRGDSTKDSSSNNTTKTPKESSMVRAEAPKIQTNTEAANLTTTTIGKKTMNNTGKGTISRIPISPPSAIGEAVKPYTLPRGIRKKVACLLKGYFRTIPVPQRAGSKDCIQIRISSRHESQGESLRMQSTSTDGVLPLTMSPMP